MGITTKSFGKTKKGEEAKLYILENKNGMKAVFSDFGAVLVELWVPDKNGKLEDVVLGFDTLAEYEANPTFFGSFIGRCGNRIGGAKFTIDGKEYKVEDLNFKPRRRKERATTDDAELRALEMLEKREGKSNLGD